MRGNGFLRGFGQLVLNLFIRDRFLIVRRKWNDVRRR